MGENTVLSIACSKSKGNLFVIHQRSQYHQTTQLISRNEKLQYISLMQACINATYSTLYCKFLKETDQETKGTEDERRVCWQHVHEWNTHTSMSERRYGADCTEHTHWKWECVPVNWVTPGARLVILPRGH